MPDFVYLLENRLSVHQQGALRAVREVAREAQMPVFLVGDAVRDLVCGNSVRELEVVIHGNSSELKKPLVAHGATVWWESSASRRLSLRFPGSVLLELTSARQTDYPKCGKPVYTWASIHEDLRSRDFTVNAMAISLNDGSYGLLMDPLNGVADLEQRQLRLVSNYGFLEEPARLVRASRLRVRLGFQLEERTQRRYENAREESMIEYLSEEERRRELEQIVHEEEALKVMASHETDGWMKALFPGWTTAKADVEKLKALHDFSIEMQMQGVQADLATAQAHYLTAKLSAKDLAALKERFLRPGFVKAWEGLEESAAQLAKQLLSKENARPSACYQLLTSFAPEAVVWLGFTTRQAAVREKMDAFLKVWPEFRQKLPVARMAEMRITPELPEYGGLIQSIFLRLIDGELQSDEEMRAFLEPYSPPAPAPQPTFKRSRARRTAEIRVKSRVVDEDEGDQEDEDSELDEDAVELDFRIGDSDEGRILGDDDDTDDDDVFARETVGEVDESEPDEDEDEPVVAMARSRKQTVASKSKPEGTVTKMAAKAESRTVAKSEPRTTTKAEVKAPARTANEKPAKTEAKKPEKPAAKPVKPGKAQPKVVAKATKVATTPAKKAAPVAKKAVAVAKKAAPAGKKAASAVKKAVPAAKGKAPSKSAGKATAKTAKPTPRPAAAKKTSKPARQTPKAAPKAAAKKKR